LGPQHAALKVPRLEALGSTELRQRFEQEAHAAAKLDHPNIVSVLEAGADGMLPYIASVYCAGPTLAGWLAAKSQPVALHAAARLIRDLATAVAHAHDRGVLHRDIKPSNILLMTTRGDSAPVRLEDCVPKLMDFGLAKLAASDCEMTRSGALLGTVRYMPPEQAGSRRGDIGPASDVYGLGAVFYELLTGRPPFDGESDLELLQKISTLEPVHPRHFRPQIPVDLETIVLKCLERSPARRYPQSQALADDLEYYLSGRPILARPAGRRERLMKWCRRNPQSAALVGVCASAAVLLVVVLSWTNLRLASGLAFAREQQALAEQSRESLREYVYGLDMRLAQEAWEHSKPDEAAHFLDKYLPRAGQKDLRGFEWNYLRQSIDQSSEVVAKQPTAVWTMALAPDETRLATADREGVIRLWSLESKSLIRELRGHAVGDIDQLQFVDNDRLISSGSDGTIRIWEYAGDAPPKVLREHSSWVGGLAVDADGKFLASGDGTGQVLLWQLPDGKPMGELYHHAGAVRWIAFYPGKPLVISACEKGEVRIWNYLERKAPPQAEQGLLESPPDPSWRNAVFRPDGEALWASDRSRLLKWNLGPRDNWSRIGREFATDHKILALALVSAGDWLLTAHDEEFQIVLRSATDPMRSERIFRGHAGRVRGVISMRGGSKFLSASEDGTVRLWRTASADGFTRSVLLPARGLALGWSPREEVVAVGLANGQLGTVAASNQEFKAIASLDGKIDRLVWSPDGERICAIVNGRRVQWCDAQTGALLNGFTVSSDIDAMALDPRGTCLAIDQRPGRLTMLNAMTGKELWNYGSGDRSLRGLRFMNDRELLAWFSDGAVQYFDSTTGRPQRALPNHRRDATFVAVSESGFTLATASKDKTIRLYDAATLKPLRWFSIDDEIDQMYFFAHDTRLLVAAGEWLHIVDAQRGQVMLTLPRVSNPWIAALNRDRTVYSAISGNTLILLQLDQQVKPVFKRSVQEPVHASR
jgi:WD40 repeat protein